jgi:hypothetical protein
MKYVVNVWSEVGGVDVALLQVALALGLLGTGGVQVLSGFGFVVYFVLV